jgi:hypothetical protein
LACRIAEAQLDLVRVRTARLPSSARWTTIRHRPPGWCPSSCASIATSVARWRRKFAVCAFEQAALPAAAARRHFGRTNLDGKSQ